MTATKPCNCSIECLEAANCRHRSDLPHRIEPEAFDAGATIKIRFVYDVEDAVIVYNAIMERAHTSTKERVLARRTKMVIETSRAENKIS